MFNLNLSFLQNIKNLINPFYKNKDLKFIFKKLQEDIPQNKIAARFVGGCVRKYLSNEKIDDIDVATILIIGCCFSTIDCKSFFESFIILTNLIFVENSFKE